MIEESEKLQKLYEKLQASKAAKHFVKIDWTNYPERLSVRNAWGGEYNDRIIHITVAEQNTATFDYQALSNKGLNSTEHFLTTEEGKGVATEEIIEIVGRLLTPEENPYSLGNEPPVCPQ